MRYLALGDSMSMDRYPAMEAMERKTALLSSREALGVETPPLGAASLLYRNYDAVWPEFAGLDLVTLHPGITLHNAAAPAALIASVLDEQIPPVADTDDVRIVTLSIGVNDLATTFARSDTAEFAGAAMALRESYSGLVSTLACRFPDASLVLTTIYDPSDGAGMIPDPFEDTGGMPIYFLDELNAHIRMEAERTPRALLADVHAHFLGHGVASREEESWYWQNTPIEPSGKGASEIRRLWWKALRRGAG